VRRITFPVAAAQKVKTLHSLSVMESNDDKQNGAKESKALCMTLLYENDDDALVPAFKAKGKLVAFGPGLDPT
jgi:hypothetical protein